DYYVATSNRGHVLSAGLTTDPAFGLTGDDLKKKMKDAEAQRVADQLALQKTLNVPELLNRILEICDETIGNLWQKLLVKNVGNQWENFLEKSVGNNCGRSVAKVGKKCGKSVGNNCGKYVAKIVGKKCRKSVEKFS
ncbi:hypothetical protein Tco_0812552, partial [Tanacetum coccineum]